MLTQDSSHDATQYAPGDRLTASSNRLSTAVFLGTGREADGGGDSIGRCVQLEQLGLYRNRIARVPRRALRGLRWLRHLDLGRNQLRCLSGRCLSGCPLLQTLVLYENRLEAAPWALQAVLLRQLWLNGNELGSLWRDEGGDAACWLPSLEFLKVSASHSFRVARKPAPSAMPGKHPLPHAGNPRLC